MKNLKWNFSVILIFEEKMILNMKIIINRVKNTKHFVCNYIELNEVSDLIII